MNWDQKFSQKEYSYGIKPNDFLASAANRIPVGGNVLSLCEGEGRNAVFLAEQGLNVSAVDGSQVGLEKARRLAAEKNVCLKTEVADLAYFVIEPGKWDAIVMIFGHLPAPLRKRISKAIVAGLKKGGLLILEGYTPRQLSFKTGGPRDITMLYEPEEIKKELDGLQFDIFQEVERTIIEGDSHTGQGAVLQILAKK